MAQAVQMALCHNPQIRASWSQISQQAAVLGQSKSTWLPQINAGITRQRSELQNTLRNTLQNPNSPIDAEHQTRKIFATTQTISINWKILDFGARSAKDKAAQAQIQVAIANQNAIALKILQDTLEIYTEAQITQTRLQTQKELIPLLERNLQAAKKRQGQGAGNTNDTLQAIAAIARNKFEISRTQGNYEKAISQLSFITGLPAGTNYQLEITTPLENQQDITEQQIEKELQNLLEGTKQNHPAIIAAKAQWQAAKENITAVQSEGLPTLDAGYAYYRNGRPNQSINTSAGQNQSSEKVASITLIYSYI